MEGTIFNIQKFSLHDGPGIRTTVFFKGCNLRCSWCANPESQSLRPQLTLNVQKCILCGGCIQACPSGARRMDAAYIAVDAAKCMYCGACMQLCPSAAIGREGRRVTVGEILDEVLKDKAFYDHSGGGVTLSGGEVLLQQEFAVDLARELHAHGVHVAVETAAAVAPEHFCAFLKEVDYVFADLKHHNSARHLEGTGVDHGQIIENLRLLAESGVPYCVRIPVIPSYNDSDGDALAFAELLQRIGIKRVQLLPFHQLGERKYSLLGRDYAYAGQPQLHREDLEHYRRLMLAQGIEAEL